MSRTRLPSRRAATRKAFFHDNHEYDLAWSCFAHGYGPGSVAEVFLSPLKRGSPLDILAQDMVICLSLALQHGTPLAAIHSACQKNPDGSDVGLLGAVIHAIACQP